MPLSADRMGNAPVLPLILTMSFPVMFSLLIHSFYNIVDSLYVARFSAQGLTALSLAFPIQTLITAIASGTGVGVNTLIARALGRGDVRGASTVARHGLVLGALSWGAFALLFLPFAGAYFRAFTHTEAVARMGQDYLFIVVLFSLGVFIETICSKILQAQGRMLFPMAMQAAGAAINIVLDPLLIFGFGPIPAMGVAGAAIATVAAQLVVMAGCFLSVLRPEREVPVTLRAFRFCGPTVWEIYAVALPSIIMQSLYTFYMTGLNAILATFSDAAVTVLGIYYKLQSFVTMPIVGLNHGILPILSFNFGARRYGRMWRVLRLSCVLAFATLIVGMGVFLMFPDWLLSLFAPTPEVLAAGAVSALRIVSLSFPLFPFTLLIPTLFQVTGYGRYSILCTLLRQVVLLVPLAYVFSRFGLFYLWFTYPVSEVIASAVAFLLTLRLARSDTCFPPPDAAHTPASLPLP